ncbi:carbohydrate-binding protein [Tamlana sp. 2_MG-2023]|uniref:carbohydrate-binding protein n=1 Tax=unclassified Tamlana TaxID=2614803 RepID=UPI0026E214BA|nr:MULTISPECIES: carbohydrate-binding protein [unclassified Tamlana]MDO6760878.1 carbohydrate-binding protein [Tamlana sp. 2_MG-2023]MDO6791134.1 carbohydrate-binding protein [Tamlana sp. 1_MG-2023]
MKKQLVLPLALFLTSILVAAQDWSGIPVPADAGAGKTWELQENVSDDFNYNFNSSSWSNFGSNNKWYNFYHNAWDGPGYTYWKNENVTVDGSDLVINVGYTSENSKGGSYGVASGCVTSNNKVAYPVYVESAISVANISLASCFWLLSPDDTEEIDIIENYGGVTGYKHLTHISHHSFVRSPFTDYQPRDTNSWYPDSRVSTSYGWGDWCYNNGGARRYMRMGVNWISPKHFEYYIDGELVRVMYYNAIATKYNGTWQYTYFNSMNWNVNGYNLPTNNGSGYTDVTVHATSSTYNFNTLKAASNASNGYNVIDPAWFQGGDDNDADGNGVTIEARGFTKELDIIINMESQSWLAGSTPSSADLNNPAKNQMKVDWVRVYKPVGSSNTVGVTGISMTPTSLALNVGNQGNLTAAVQPTNATVKTMTFTSNNTNVATVNQSGVVTAVANGTATITAKSTDGNYTDTSTVTVSSSTSGGSGSAITVEAESFASTGGTFNDGFVPLGMNKTNSTVNYVNKQDYANYNINVSQAGTYNIAYQVSTPMSNAQIAIYVNNILISTDNVVNNGTWDNYQTLNAGNTANLSAGSHTVKIVASGSNNWQWNMDKFVLTKTGGSTTASNAEIIIEAESFNSTTGTYNDGFVPLGMNKGTTLVNYVNSNDSATYNINVSQAGTYNIAYMISTPSNNAKVSMYVDNVLVSTDNVVNNGSWGSFQTLNANNSVSLTTGAHTVKIVASGSNAWQWNMDKIILSSNGSTSKQSLSKVSNSEKVLTKIYPNPANSTIFIETSKTLNGVRLINAFGQVVLSQNGEQKAIRLDNFSNGIYFLELNFNEDKEIKKVIIKH